MSINSVDRTVESILAEMADLAADPPTFATPPKPASERSEDPDPSSLHPSAFILHPSPARLAANQQNAQKSTGPRTDQGKHTSSQNATTHALTSTRHIVPEAELPTFEPFLTQTLADLAPQGPVERALATKIALTLFQLDRAAAAEARLLHHHSTHAHDEAQSHNDRALADYQKEYAAQTEANLRRKRPYLPDKPRLHDVPEVLPTEQVLADFFDKPAHVHATPLDRIARYTTTLDLQLHRALKQLQSLQKLRRAHPPQAPDLTPAPGDTLDDTPAPTSGATSVASPAQPPPEFQSLTNDQGPMTNDAYAPLQNEPTGIPAPTPENTAAEPPPQEAPPPTPQIAAPDQ